MNAELRYLPEDLEPAAPRLAQTRDGLRPVGDIIADLSSRKEPVRTAAEADLCRLGSEAADDLLDALNHEGVRYKRRKRAVRNWKAAAVCLAAWYVAVAVILGTTANNWMLLTEPTWLFAMGALFGSAAAVSPKHQSVLHLIGRLDDVRAVGWLVDATDTDDAVIRYNVEQALIRILPRLTPADAAPLDADRRRALDGKLLNSYGEFARAILAAYKLIGDSQSLEAVDSVASGGNKVPYVEEIRTIARETSEAIRVRAETAKRAQTLLRPSCESVAAASLLRPAEGGETMNQELLLRTTECSAP